MPLDAADPFYYLANFQALLDALARRDGDLLIPEERRFMEDFAALGKAPRALLVRMIMRKGPLFRASRLAYGEIGEVGAAIGPLLERGWVDERAAPTWEELFRLFVKSEMTRWLKLPAHLAREPKARLLEHLRNAQPPPAPAPETVYRLAVAPLCLRLRMMFFGNFRQDLSEFVLSDLGVFRYESVHRGPGSRPFDTRRQVEGFFALHRCREMLHDGSDPAQVEDSMPPPFADCEWLEDRRQRLRFKVGREYERAGLDSRAAQVYANCPHPQAQTRMARLLARSSGAARRGAPAASGMPVFVLTLDRMDLARPVEQRVLDHLRADAAEQTLILHAENSLINSLFGLLCWPAVFAPVPGAFFHPFHREPADLWSGGFFARRRQEFAECFEQLRSGAYRGAILRRFAASRGVVSPFVAWGLLDESLLHTALDCFPADHLRLWFEWMVSDLKSNRAGFPDLVQFFPAARRYRLIEVKAPGDRLQRNQRLCLQFMLRNGMPVSVCRVRWSGAAAEDPCAI